MSDTLTRVMPSATPTDEEIAAWNELPRAEQLKRYRELLQPAYRHDKWDHGEIVAEAHRRSDLRRRVVNLRIDTPPH